MGPGPERAPLLVLYQHVTYVYNIYTHTQYAYMLYMYLGHPPKGPRLLSAALLLDSWTGALSGISQTVFLRSL